MAIDALVLGAVALGAPIVVKAIKTEYPERSGGGAGKALAIVIGLIYLNQLACTIYIIRVHDADPAFIAGSLPPGWFALADGPAMRAIAGAVPWPELLAPSVLRVQAFLELPFVLLAYLCVARWLQPRFARALASPAVLATAAVAYSIVFSLVEWSLPNPYTNQDLALRALSCIVTPLLIGRFAPIGTAGAPAGAVDVLLAVVSAAALGAIVLLVYDTALLYNLGHVPALLPLAAAALAVLAAARLAARRRARGGEPGEPGPAIDTVRTGLAWFTALFLIPALPIRYALDLATMWLTVAAAAAVALAGLALTLRDVAARHPGPATWIGRLAAAGVAGTAAASAALLPPPTLPEVRILLAAALFLTVATGVCAAMDAAGKARPDRSRDWSPTRKAG